MSKINKLKKIRLEKLEQLRKKGIDPYPAKVQRDQVISQAQKVLEQDVAIVGRVMGMRGHGKLQFIDLVDESGKIQIALKTDFLKKQTFELIELLDIGDFLAVQGKVGKTESGELTVFASDFQIITKTLLPLPDQWYGLKDVEERFRKRYLDMIMNPQVKDRFRVRAVIIDAIREFLDKKDFIEVETPTLQPVYGGGFARPFVTHHRALDSDFYLRISDEMYLKRLIVGGMEKVYEITKVFRNEGIDRDHNPEFTMFEAQIAFQDYNYGMDLIEEITEYAAKKALGSTKFTYQGRHIDVRRPWRKIKMAEAIKKHTNCDPMNWKTSGEAKEVISEMNIDKERLKDLEKMRSIGEMMAFVFEEKVEKKLIQPTFIYDYPVEVSPLAKKCEDPRFTQRFEQFICGSEVGNNYSELNDPVDLRTRFVEEKKREKAGFEETHQTDDDYLEAMEYGFPPTCGIAIGIDRLVMLFTDAANIKEIITFPTLRPKKTAKQNKNGNNKGKKLDLGIDYKKAKQLLDKYLKDPINRMHSIETEAIMKALCLYLCEKEMITDEEKRGNTCAELAEAWGIIGLLHDLDWELTKDDIKKHTVKTREILKKEGGSDYLVETIQSHNFGRDGENDEAYRVAALSNKRRTTKIQHALAAAESLTGLIVASALVQPDKKLASVKLKSLKKKYKSKAFAANCNREIILECEKIGLTLDEFQEIGLKALQEIAGDLGL